MRIAHLIIPFALALAAPVAARQPEVLPPAAVTVDSPGPERVGVTVYRAPDRHADEAIDTDWLQGYALVTETRTVTIPKGRAVVRFQGVAGGMLAESAIVTGLPDGVREKNLDAELLSPRNLYARSFGRPVLIRRDDPKSGEVREEQAIIRSGPDGAAILQTRNGFEALNCRLDSDVIAYDAIPDGLFARPTLSIETDAGVGGTYQVTLSYLAWGFDWQANYVATMSTDGRNAELMAWVTLASTDPTSFADAETAVVAGKLNRKTVRERGYSDDDDGDLTLHCLSTPIPKNYADGIIAQDVGALPAPPMATMLARSSETADIIVTGFRASMVVQEELGDLKLYRVPFPTTVAAMAQKQVALLQRPRVPVTIVYTSDIFSDGVDDPIIELRAENKVAQGLGVPLPAGPVAVFEPHGDTRLLVGEGSLDDKAVGEDVEVKLSSSPQVHAEIEAVESDKYVVVRRLTLTNANAHPIRFEGKFRLSDSEKIERPSAKLGRKDGLPLWSVTVPANGSSVLTYRVRNPLGND